MVCWWERRHIILLALLGESTFFVSYTSCAGGSHIFVCRTHVCPRFGNSWKKGKASLQEYVLRDSGYYEISLIPVDRFGEKELRAPSNSRMLVGATYNVKHRSERFGGSHCMREK